MPICTWCGVDSKNDVVCDWCKRPLNLRNSRFTGATVTNVGGKSGIDLLADDDDSNTVLPKVMVAAVVVFICAAIAILFGVANMNKQPEAPIASNTPPVAPVKETFTEGRISQAAVQTSYVPPPPRVFLPPSTNTASDNFRSVTSTMPMGGGVSSNVVVEEEGGPSFGISAAKLTNARKPDGTMICYGSIKLFNSSIDNIIDFDITLVTGKKKYSVKPFTGTLENTEPFLTRVVHAKEALNLPIIVQDYKGDAGTVQGKIVVTVTLDSTPKPQTLEATLGSGDLHPSGKAKKK